MLPDIDIIVSEVLRMCQSVKWRK